MNKLKQRREELHFTQKQVAIAVGIAESAYQRYEYGKILPSVNLAIKFANVFKCSVESLFVVEDK